VSNYPSTKKIQYSDIVVIGAGIAGISVAAKLSATANVTVVEAESHAAFHSTGRSAAIFVENYGNSILRALNKMSLPELSGKQTDSHSDPISSSVLSRRGVLLLVGEDDEEACQDYLGNSSGIEHVSPDEAMRMVPCLKAESFNSAIYEADASDIDVDLLLNQYLKQLRRNQGVLCTDTRVRSISRSDEMWLLDCQQGTFAAPIIINAAGAWADMVAQLAGLPAIGLSPCRRSMAQFDVAAGGISSWPLFGNVSETWYAKPQGANLLLSPADEDPVEPHDAWPEDEVLAAAIERFETMVDLPLSRPTHQWAGLRTFATDRTPVVGADPLIEGFYWLAGQGGYGIQTAPALSSILSSQVIARENPATKADKLLCEKISPARFRHFRRSH